MSADVPRPTSDASPIIRINNAAIEIEHMDIETETRIDADRPNDDGYLRLRIADCQAIPPGVLSTLAAYELDLISATPDPDGITVVIA
jgi:hypothetical protein